LARGFLAYDLTGSNSALGGVMLGFGVPSLLFGLWGGVIVDRVRKRPLLIAAQIVTAATSTFIAVAITIDVIAYWMLVVAAAVQATSFSVVGPGRMAFTTSLVPRGQLPNAIAL